MSYELCDCEDVLNDLFEGVYFVDKDRGITFWNQAAERITGFSANEMLGRHCYDNLLNHVDENGKQLCFDGCPLHASMQDGNLHTAKVFLRHKHGHRLGVDVRVRPLIFNNEIIGAAEVFSVTEDDNQGAISFKTMERMALYDQLTQLPNRRYLDSYLSNQMRDYQTLGISFGVLMLDLDFFKKVNDTYGHNVGDLILKMVADTFSGAMRRSDFIGRWGGEEFIAILRNVNGEELRMISEKLRNLVEKSRLTHADGIINVTVSIGATTVKSDDNISSLISRADNALYTSKREGRNRVTVL